MSVLFWILVLCVLCLVFYVPGVAYGRQRGPRTLQQLGSVLVGGFYRALGSQLVIATIMYWLLLSFTTGFRLGLGVGISPDVTPARFAMYFVEWSVLMLLVAVIFPVAYGENRFKWVPASRSERLAITFVLRARVWNRSREGLQRFLLRYHEKFGEENSHIADAFTLLSMRADWIGEVGREVLNRINSETSL